MVLLGRRQARKQRQHFGPPVQRRMRQVAAQVIGSFADFPLAGQEDEDVAAGAAGPEFVHAVGNRLVQAVVAAFLERLPALFHRKHPARDHDDGRRPGTRREMLREAVGIDRGRGHDHFQVGPPRQDLAQVAQKEVDVQAAFVGLVDDDRVVGLEQRVGLGFCQQDAVGHQLDRGIAAQPVLKAHLEAHHVAQRRVKLLGDALGHRAGGNAPGLRMADQAPLARQQLPVRPLGPVEPPAPHGERDLGQLRGLSRAGFAADDDDLVLLKRGHDLVALA
jgi:hypothetical protein